KSLGLDLNRVDYFPVNDYARVEEGSFITAFPEGENLWLLNVGSEEARVDCIGNQKFHISIPSKSGVSFPMKELPKGRVRVVYNDSSGTEVNDEGLLSLI